ncbi:hypothetical protein ASPCAL15014 [Aspergillus calidoustus]|uniref:F-box domain-containing protein n=1 Tax=Aspergillus calidoustus TaxID=454130 RepID=A0A0U5GJH8_ASPCI|nr:hypothetical protein ASPCAL15014 [Aspergillus calidoustus]
MASNLPRELIFVIAEHLNRDGGSLLPYALVCRSWQPVFESFIFSTVTVHSGERDGTKAREQKGFSLEDFKRATSGQNSRRRAWIREVRYDIIVPYELLDWSNTKWDESYTVDNPVRKANDEAFQAAMTELFTTVLSSWDQTHRLSLHIGLLGCKQGFELEPGTSRYEDAGDYRFDFTDGRTEALPPYRARLSDFDALSIVPCVDKLTFINSRHRFKEPFLFYEEKDDYEDEYDPEQDPRPRNRWHQIWAGTVFQIAERCRTITELHLNLDEYVRPDHLEYIQERRAAVAEGVRHLPSSLRVFNYLGYKEEPWKETMSALNVLNAGVDTLAGSLRGLTYVLRELRLTYVTISLDFLCPLNPEGQPTANCTSHWPNLQVLTLHRSPPFTPQGKWLALPDTEEQQIIDEVSDWETEICNTERGFISRPVLDAEQIHRLSISWGLAARHMPQIAVMEYHMTHGSSKTDFEVRMGDEITLRWKSRSTYVPDQRVAKAWGFDLKDMTSHKPLSYSVVLPSRPAGTE